MFCLEYFFVIRWIHTCERNNWFPRYGLKRRWLVLFEILVLNQRFPFLFKHFFFRKRCIYTYEENQAHFGQKRMLFSLFLFNAGQVPAYICRHFPAVFLSAHPLLWHIFIFLFYFDLCSMNHQNFRLEGIEIRNKISGIAFQFVLSYLFSRIFWTTRHSPHRIFCSDVGLDLFLFG